MPHAATELAGDRPRIRRPSVRADLRNVVGVRNRLADEPLFQIGNEHLRHLRIALAHGERGQQLRIRVQRRKKVNVPDAGIVDLVAATVALLLPAEGPDFIALDVTQTEVRQRLIKEIAASFPNRTTSRMIVLLWMPVSRTIERIELPSDKSRKI